MDFRSVTILGVIALIAASCFSVDGDGQEVKKNEKVLRHVVLFKFKDECSEEQIQEVADAFAALPKKIDTIIDFEWGTDISVENKHKGFTHGFLVTFADEKGRETYLPHPDHKEFGKLVGPRLADVLVFDYWSKK
ncbi:MAG: Dabb family protein [Pirellulaceae bacterium]